MQRAVPESQHHPHNAEVPVQKLVCLSLMPCSQTVCFRKRCLVSGTAGTAARNTTYRSYAKCILLLLNFDVLLNTLVVSTLHKVQTWLHASQAAGSPAAAAAQQPVAHYWSAKADLAYQPLSFLPSHCCKHLETKGFLVNPLIQLG